MKKFYVGLVLLFFVYLETGLSQKKCDLNQLETVTENSSCEDTEMRLHTVYLEFEKKGLNDSYLVVIGKGALGEKASYNSKRISQVIDYFVKLGVEKKRIEFAKGKPEDEFGHVKILVNGKLILIMKTKKKGVFCTYCCEGK